MCQFGHLDTGQNIWWPPYRCWYNWHRKVVMRPPTKNVERESGSGGRDNAHDQKPNQMPKKVRRNRRLFTSALQSKYFFGEGSLGPNSWDEDGENLRTTVSITDHQYSAANKRVGGTCLSILFVQIRLPPPSAWIIRQTTATRPDQPCFRSR